jgi:hypothetical protein
MRRAFETERQALTKQCNGQWPLPDAWREVAGRAERGSKRELPAWWENQAGDSGAFAGNDKPWLETALD